MVEENASRNRILDERGRRPQTAATSKWKPLRVSSQAVAALSRPTPKGHVQKPMLKGQVYNYMVRLTGVRIHFKVAVKDNIVLFKHF